MSGCCSKQAAVKPLRPAVSGNRGSACEYCNRAGMASTKKHCQLVETCVACGGWASRCSVNILIFWYTRISKYVFGQGPPTRVANLRACKTEISTDLTQGGKFEQHFDGWGERRLREWLASHREVVATASAVLARTTTGTHCCKCDGIAVTALPSPALHLSPHRRGRLRHRGDQAHGLLCRCHESSLLFWATPEVAAAAIAAAADAQRAVTG